MATMRPLYRKPRKGDRIGFGEFVSSERQIVADDGSVFSLPCRPTVTPPARATCTVTEVVGELCWTLRDGAEKPLPFIWTFHDLPFNQLAHIEEE
jgi:hypothetical protein